MNKKEIARARMTHLKEGHDIGTLRDVLFGIIDALPEAPLKDAAQKIMGVPEPKEVKESHPTSALTPLGEALEWLYDLIERDGQTKESYSRQVRHARELIDAHKRILGPQQPPNVASPAQPPIGPFVHTGEGVVGPEDFRKLRIMKAMEDISAKQPGAKFEIYKDEWYQRLPEGRLGINDYYSPKEPEPYKCGAQREEEAIAARKAAEPLWEGEILVNTKLGVSDYNPCLPVNEPWRRIKVKEVR